MSKLPIIVRLRAEVADLQTRLDDCLAVSRRYLSALRTLRVEHELLNERTAAIASKLESMREERDDLLERVAGLEDNSDSLVIGEDLPQALKLSSTQLLILAHLADSGVQSVTDIGGRRVGGHAIAELRDLRLVRSGGKRNGKQRWGITKLGRIVIERERALFQ